MGQPQLLRICRAESCRSMGCDELVRHTEERMGITLGHTTPDGRFALAQIFCLGMCSASPAVMLDDALYGRVTAEVIDELLG